MKRRGKEGSQELKNRLTEASAQQKFEDYVTCTTWKKSKGECNQQTRERQEISEDEDKDACMNYAFAVSSKGVQWNVIFVVLTIIFSVVKGTLQWNEKSVIYGDFVSCTKTKRNLASKIRDWQILIEKKEEWKEQLRGLHICKEEKGRMKGRKAKENNKEHNS